MGRTLKINLLLSWSINCAHTELKTRFCWWGLCIRYRWV